MESKLAKASVTKEVALILLVTVIFTGISGLISLFFLMVVSRLNIGRDPIQKHGVSSGASRLGGIAIIFSLMISILANLYLAELLSFSKLKIYFDKILLFSIIIGLVGLVEDLSQNLTSYMRLFLIIMITSISLILMPELIPYKLSIFNYPGIVNNIIIVYLFTIMMVSGFINAGNIADGANGLLPVIFLIFFICINFVDPTIFNLSITISLLVFSIYNIGTGRIFLGDFGAYLLSALVAFHSLRIYAKYNVSVFLFASILVYPCFEITRSLILRFFNQVAIMSPDNSHLHNYINKYFLSLGFNSHISNSMTGISVALFSAGPALLSCINNISVISNWWLYLFLGQLFFLSGIYLIFKKIHKIA